MKKKSNIVLFFLCIFVLVGCSSKEEKVAKKAIDELASMGFSKNNAKEFYNFANSTKIIFNKMTEINDSMIDNSYTVSNDDYKTVDKAVETSKEFYKELVPKEFDEYNEYLTNSENKMRSPLLILGNIEDTKRQFKDSEAAMMFDNLTYFADIAIESNGLSDKERIKALNWYHSNNNYTDLFKEAYNIKNNN